MTEPLISPEFLTLQSAVAGRYSLVRELGRGGMGVVFLAREVSLDRLVAIKLLPPRYNSDQAVCERFLREARTAARLAHPHIVPIHAVETTGNCVFFVMEYVEGSSLGDRLQRGGPLGHDEALRVARETVWALGHAHSRGVIHRDIKPDNILLDAASGRAVVTDFGIARQGDDHDSAAGHGTLHYMSPEQALGDPVDARADIYSLGVTLYHAVSGRRPFEGRDAGALLAAQAGADVPSVRTVAPDVAPALAQVIDRAIHRDPAQRFADADEMAAALQAVHAVAPQLPAPLVRFARHSVEHGRQLGPMLGLVGASFFGAAFVDAFLSSFMGFETILYMVIGTIGSVVSVGLLAEHIREIRALAGKGYSRQSAMHAVGMVDAEEARVAESVGGPAWLKRPQAVISLGMAVTLAGLFMLSKADSAALGMTGLTLSLFTPALAVARVARLKGITGSWWARVQRSRVGRWLWSGATVGQHPVADVAVGGEPTALAVGQLVQQLWRALPSSEQQLLAEVPDLAERLERVALERESPHATEAMAALETLRLDLMRLRAGQLNRESITEDLGKLREFGMYVDARDESDKS
jgi:predicted Ser/Thr protein kinase